MFHFPENNDKKIDYMTLSLVAPDRQTGERPEISQKEGKYLHIYLDFIRSLLWSFCLQKLSGVCVCVFLLFKWKSLIILQNLILEDMKRGKLSVKLIVLELINGEGNGTPLQYSCLENPMDGGAW